MLNKDAVTPESIIDALTKKREERQKLEEAFFEKEQEWRAVIDRLCGNDDFVHFLQGMVRFTGFTKSFEGLDPASLVKASARRDVYLKVLRPYLDATTKQKVES